MDVKRDEDAAFESSAGKEVASTAAQSQLTEPPSITSNSVPNAISFDTLSSSMENEFSSTRISSTAIDVEQFLSSTAALDEHEEVLGPSAAASSTAQSPPPWLLLPQYNNSSTNYTTDEEILEALYSSSSTADDGIISSSIQDMRDQEELMDQEIEYISSARPVWQPDAAAPVCSSCQSKFSFTKRRHHCRACGRIFCDECCKDKVKLPHLGYSSRERVCLDCARSLPRK
eukprot:TRINITY_DN3485_c0_g1_i2.p1 TRINITY_DN3485_c0_g1~~TRINITY_DN3485_c0_g1_i2.p1  ORF type:complete len:230 (-),score=37.12 TRINITY_DN3485_c0_g1_i2:511-1200(-)